MALLWIIMFLCIFGFFIIQHSKRYNERSNFEKVVTWFAIISIVAAVLSVMWF